MSFLLGVLVVWLAAQVPELPAGLEASGSTVQRGVVLYVPLVTGGIGVIDLSTPATPRHVRTVVEGRQFSRLLLDGEQLIALETREEAVTLSLGSPLEPSAVRPPPHAAQAVPRARTPAPTAAVLVVDVTQGRVVFAGGTALGFRKGVRVRVLSQRAVQKPDLVTGTSADVPSGEVTAVLSIEQAEDYRAMAVLGRGDYAEKGDLVELTDEPLSERLLFPRRAPFDWRVGFVARPFLGLEGTTKPVGFLIDAYAAWYPANVPISVAVAIAPAGFVINGAEGHYPVTAHLVVAYNTDYFEIGVGAGALIGNPGPCVVLAGCEVNTGATINQRLRLGALDGLHVEWNSSIFARPDRFVFGVGRGEVAVPLTSHLGLFGAGGGGENGWAFGEFGVRTALSGAGASGTIVLSASLGFSSIFDGPSREFVGGPAVSFGAEWRL